MAMRRTPKTGRTHPANNLHAVSAPHLSKFFSQKVIDMNRLLSQTARAVPAALVFAAAAALSTGAHADAASKKALAVKLAQLQQKNASALLAGQIADSAMQQLVAKWLPQVEAHVPAAKQKEVGDQLNVELKKFNDSTHQAVQAQTVKTAQDALVPLFLDKLSENDLKTIVAYLETPASAKYATLSSEAINAWTKKIVENTQTAVQGYAKTFDAAAGKIISAAATSAPAASASVPANSAPATPASAPASSAPATPANTPASSAPATPASTPASSASNAQ
jgi:hypothetical protein